MNNKSLSFAVSFFNFTLFRQPLCPSSAIRSTSMKNHKPLPHYGINPLQANNCVYNQSYFHIFITSKLKMYLVVKAEEKTLFHTHKYFIIGGGGEREM